MKRNPEDQYDVLTFLEGVLSFSHLRHLPQPPEFGIVVVEDPGESDVKKHNKKPLPFLKKCFHFVLKMIFFGNASQE